MIEKPVEFSEVSGEEVNHRPPDDPVAQFNPLQELREIQGLFPEHGLDDFYWLESGNMGTIVTFERYGDESEDFKIVLEYPESFPEVSPIAWLLSPEIDETIHHCWRTDYNMHDEEYLVLSYIDSSMWEETYTSYDALVIIQSWIEAYENYRETDTWDWS